MMLRRWMAAGLAAAAGITSALSAPVFAAPVEDGVLRTAISFDITTLDVAQTTDDYMVPMNVYDRLFETRMADGTAVIVNSLCTDFAISDDGLVYDFTLKDGVVFSNGNTLTSSDVQYSFERLLIAAGDNTDIPLEVVGAEALMNGEADKLEGFEVKDDTHFSITLAAPNAGFLAELSAPAMSIFDAESMADVKDFGKDPKDVIGTGPYIITEWVANDHYTLEYNDRYWGLEPTVKKAVVSVIPDANTRNLMFQNGELDMIDLGSIDSAVVASTYKTQYADSIVSTPKVGLIFLLLNNSAKYLEDVKVRKAIGMAVDVDSIINGIYNGDAHAEHGIIATGIFAHNDYLEGFTYDPAAAKELLAEAGYKDGEISFELSMDSTANSNIQLTYQLISQMLEEVGIKATIKSYDHAAFIDKRMTGTMDSFIGRWGMDYNDPANIMYTFFGSAQNTKQRSLNYADAGIIERVSAARAIVDDYEREEEYQALEEKIVGEDAAWIPLLEDLHLYCIGDRVASFTPQWAGFTDFFVTDMVLK